MKKELRKKYLDIRSKIPPALHAEKSQKIFDSLITLDAYKEAKSVMIFLDFRGEVLTRPIINAMLQEGKTVALPVVNFDTIELILVRIDSLDNLVECKYGIMEPPVTEENTMDPDAFDLILAPGAVFDARGYRIGYGGGFYDKMLSKLTTPTTVIGLAFSEQMIDEVPHESFDQPLDAVITDEKVIICNQ